MSRSAITVGHPHGGGTPTVITGPHVPLPEQRQAMRDRKAKREDPDFARVELWTSDGGVITKKRFDKPAKKAEAPKAPDPKDKKPDTKTDPKAVPPKTDPKKS